MRKILFLLVLAVLTSGVFASDDAKGEGKGREKMTVIKCEICGGEMRFNGIVKGERGENKAELVCENNHKYYEDNGKMENRKRFGRKERDFGGNKKFKEGRNDGRRERNMKRFDGKK